MKDVSSLIYCVESYGDAIQFAFNTTTTIKPLTPHSNVFVNIKQSQTVSWVDMVLHIISPESLQTNEFNRKYLRFMSPMLNIH